MQRSVSLLSLAVALTASPVLAEAGTALPPTPAPAVPAIAVAPEVGVPFGCGMSFPISQVHNVGSHVGNDSWAWDFRMPEGTPVVAALDGLVRLARGDSDEGGCDPAMARKANYVVIESPGNVETQYLHFSSVTVVPGQHVHRGDLLGYSGKTGWACGAHLHFKVATPVSAGWNNPSVEARLQGYGDPALESWVSSPPCTAPLEVATQQPPPALRQGDPVPRTSGDARPAALTAAGSAGEAAISAGGRAASERRAPTEGPVPGDPAVGEQSATGAVPFTSGMLETPAPPVPWAAAPVLSAPPPSLARPADAPSASRGEPRDSEPELLEDAEAAPAPAHR